MRRVAAIEALSRAGIPAGVLAAPMIPGLNDAELESILRTARRAGASHAGYVLLRLPLELRDLVTAWLHEHFPDRARHVLALIRDTRAGKTYDSSFGVRQTGVGPYADLLARRFAVCAKQLGFETRTGLDTMQFNAGLSALPCAPVRAEPQMSLAL